MRLVSVKTGVGVRAKDGKRCWISRAMNVGEKQSGQVQDLKPVESGQELRAAGVFKERTGVLGAMGRVEQERSGQTGQVWQTGTLGQRTGLPGR